MFDAFRLIKIIDPVAIVVGGLVPKGVYSGATAYAQGDSVSYNGASYVALGPTTGNLPTNTTYWQLISAQGPAGAASTVPGPAGADGLVTSIVAGTGISVNSTTPSAPIVTANFAADNLHVLRAGDTMTGTLNINIGGLVQPTLTNPTISIVQNANATVQGNIMNLSSGGSASSDWVATADTGSDTSNYVNMGINSSGYSNPAYTIVGALGSYLYSDGGDLAIGTQTAGKKLIFHTGGTLAANERMRITDTGLGIGTTAPTHSLTLASAATGIALYNTSDQVTNYERLIIVAGSTFSITTGRGGTGTIRNLSLGTTNRSFIISEASANGSYQMAVTDSTANPLAVISGTNTASSGTFIPLTIKNVINQSVTAGYTAMLINVTETATGSGTKRLLDLQIGGTSYLNVDNRGTLNAIGPSGTSPTNSLINLAPNNSTTGNYLLNFNIDRAWGFRQLSTGATTSLELHAQTDAKQFLITSLGSTQAGTIDFSLNDSGSFIGIGNNPSVLPTHSLTLGSTATGIALYNTSDQTTNYERGILSWQLSQLVLTTASGGTGTIRPLVIGTVNRRVTFTEAYTTTAGVMNFQGSTTSLSGGILAQFQGTSTNSAGIYYGLVVAPIINQSSAGGYTAFQVNATETATGSGAKLLADFQVGGSSKFTVDNTGHVIITGQLQRTVVSPVATGNVALTTHSELISTGASAITRTLYTPVGHAGEEVYMQKVDAGAGTVTVATAAGTIIGGITSLATQFKRVTYISDGTNWIVKDNN